MKIATCLATLGLMCIVSGCATPVLMLKNDKTGQIARCGGDASGSIAGGLIGYNIQKKNDNNCAKDYEDQGFTPISNSQ